MARFSIYVASFCLLITVALFAGQRSIAADDPAGNTTDKISQTMATAQQAGMPVLALGISDSCGYCKALVSQLQTDRALQPMLSQFVVLPLKMDDPAWRDWSQKYKSPGNGLPLIYIVRADGELVNAVSGLPEGNGLALMFRDGLSKSGMILNPVQAKKLSTALDKAKQAIEAKDTEAALTALVPISGSGSYAGLAIESDKLMSDLLQEGDKQIAEAETRLKDPEQALAGAQKLLEANRLYSRVPAKKQELAKLIAQYTRDDATSAFMDQAQLLVRADAMIAERKQESAVRSLQLVTQRYPDTPAAEEATKRLAELGQSPSSKSVTATTVSSTKASPRDAQRTWSDVTGRFRIEAMLQSHADGKVTLKKADGTLVVVPLEKLSAADRAFVAEVDQN